MSPTEYQSQVQPELVARWPQRCFCGSSQFCKLISYDFRDYGPDTSALVDAEILIASILRKNFQSLGPAVDLRGVFVQEWQCPQCGVRYREEQEQFSTAMWRSFVRRSDSVLPLVVGLYLVGFRSFPGFRPAKAPDFARSPSVEEYVGGITAAT